MTHGMVKQKRLIKNEWHNGTLQWYFYESISFLGGRRQFIPARCTDSWDVWNQYLSLVGYKSDAPLPVRLSTNIDKSTHPTIVDAGVCAILHALGIRQMIRGFQIQGRQPGTHPCVCSAGARIYLQEYILLWCYALCIQSLYLSRPKMAERT